MPKKDNFEFKKPHPLLLAWAAGVFDKAINWPAQGYTLQFETVDEAIVKRFHEVIQYGKTVNRGKRVRTIHDLWRWQTTNADDTREVLLLLSPFLSPRQVTNASKMIAKVERLPKWQKDHPEKAASLVIQRAKNAESETQQGTQTDGSTVSQPDAK